MGHDRFDVACQRIQNRVSVAGQGNLVLPIEHNGFHHRLAPTR